MAAYQEKNVANHFSNLKEEHPCRIDSSARVFVVTRVRETLARLFCFYSERPDEGNLGTVVLQRKCPAHVPIVA